MINEISEIGKQNGIVRLYTEDYQLNGRHIQLKNKKYLYFGSCGYLGLELDSRLKEAAIDAVKRYGIQFVCSRTYVACGLYKELEENLNKIFDAQVVVYPKVSQGHLNVLPIIVSDKDMVIFDQQAHVSMQEAVYKLRQNGTEITILRHNNMSDLEEKIKDYRHKYNKIWYIIDGVYSMFGDSPNYNKLQEFTNQYKQLYLYIDDAHGMSWAGKHGSGYALSHLTLSQNIVLVASLTKGFGAVGGAFVFKNEELYNKVNSWGGSYTYAGPLESATLGAAIASSKIHLSDEIYELQKQLKEKIEYCYSLLEQKNLPVISTAHSPIFYIGLGTTSMGYNMVKRVMNDGYYTNLGIYPAVPESCTGLRFTITNHLTLNDIEGLVDSIAYNLPLALKDENRSIKDIARAFRKYVDLESIVKTNTYDMESFNNKEELTLETYHSISQLNTDEWDNLMTGRGTFTSGALKIYELAFNGNEEKHSNWNFIYYIIRHNGEIVLATFFTVSLNKDDLLSPEKVSQKVEEIRNADPYYLTSLSLLMGSQLSNGEHLYVNYNNPKWKEAVKKLISDLWLKQEQYNSNLLFIRELNPEQAELCSVINDMGFAKVELPDNNIIFCQNENLNLFFDTLNKKQRYNIRKEISTDIEEYKIVNSKCNEQELQYCYNLYLQTKKQKLALNTFDLPYKFFETSNKSDDWEIVRIFYKNHEEPISMGICYRHKQEYCTVVYGMNNEERFSVNSYKKTLYLVVKHALNIGCNIIHMGITAEETKHMFGAKRIKQVGFAVLKDNYNALLLKSMED
jgi:7-keto-8-aminopelargonate synthetase-like enzyme